VCAACKINVHFSSTFVSRLTVTVLFIFFLCFYVFLFGANGTFAAAVIDNDARTAEEYKLQKKNEMRVARKIRR